MYTTPVGVASKLKDDELTWDIDDQWLRENLLPCPKSSGAFVLHRVRAVQALRRSDRAQHVLSRSHLPYRIRAAHSARVGADYGRHGKSRLRAQTRWRRVLLGTGQDGKLGVQVGKDCPEWSGPNPPQAWACSGFPVAVVCPNGPCRFTDISAGDSHTCAVDTSGDAWCWGSNRYGGLGHRITELDRQWKRHSTARRNDAQIQLDSRGTCKTCGLTTMGEVYCWGINDLAIVPANSDPTRIVVVPELVDMPTRAPVVGDRLVGPPRLRTDGVGQSVLLGDEWGSGHRPRTVHASAALPQLPATPQLHAELRHHGPRHAAREPGVDRCSRILRAPHQRADCVLGPPAASARLSCADRAIVARCDTFTARSVAARCAAPAMAPSVTACPTPRANVDPWRWRASISELSGNNTGNYATCAIGYDDQVYCWGDSSYGVSVSGWARSRWSNPRRCSSRICSAFRCPTGVAWLRANS